MKKIILLLLCAVLFTAVQAQDNFDKNWRIGISYASFGDNEPINIESRTGAASLRGDGFFGIGAHAIRPLNNWLEFETGIEYQKHKIKLKPNLPPDMDNSVRKEDFSLINIPLTVRAKFLNYFFANGGLLLDFDGGQSSSMPSQDGIGFMLGLGARYEFDCGFSIFVNPYAKWHASIAFSMDKYDERMVEDGVRIGITYRLGKK
jgi:hypothetical protein